MTSRRSSATTCRASRCRRRVVRLLDLGRHLLDDLELTAQAPPLGRLRWLAVRTAADSPGLIAALRSAVLFVDRELPLSDIQTMRQRMAGSVGPQKLAMDPAGMFAVVALFLSVLGVYGVLAYVVSQKVREIGIRIALGSPSRDIFRIVFREGFVLVASGEP